VLTKPDVAVLALLAMAAGWFVVMNVIQPRLMASAVGIHPIVVFGSVIVGVKMAGIVGAIFGIPIAAVISSFFFYYLNRSATVSREVTSRVARKLESREAQAASAPPEPPSTRNALERSATLTEPSAADPGDGQAANRTGPEPNPQRP
jgi:phosphate/sulfate permease